MSNIIRIGRHWAGIRRLRRAVAAGCLVAAGATFAAPGANAGAVQPPPPYPCTPLQNPGNGGVVCHGGRARAVLIYVFRTWYGSQLTSTVGPCVNPGNVSIAVIPASRWAAGAAAVGIGAQSC